MRAVNLAVIVFLLSIGASVANSLAPSLSLQANETIDTASVKSQAGEIATNQTGWWAVPSFLTAAGKAVKLLWDVVRGSFLLGDTVNSLFQSGLGVGLPQSLVYGLDGLSIIAVAALIVGFVRGMTLD